jgi:hypothetical protein
MKNFMGAMFTMLWLQKFLSQEPDDRALSITRINKYVFDHRVSVHRGLLLS